MKDNNPAKQEIYTLLHKHKELREEVRKVPEYEKEWRKYNSEFNPNIDSIFEISIFEEIEKKFDIQFSNETKYFYSTIGGNVRVHNEKIIRDDFCSKIYYYTQDNNDFAKSYLEYTFSKTFVIKIIHKLHELNEKDINELTSKVREKAGINYKLDSKEELLTYILDIGGGYYDGKLNIFKNDFIQSCYQELNSDESMIYPLLILWGHCGGVGYLILHKDYEDLMCFEAGNPPYIEYNGSKQYYRLFESHFDLNNENSFLLVNYKTNIIKSLNTLQNILDGAGVEKITENKLKKWIPSNNENFGGIYVSSDIRRKHSLTPVYKVDNEMSLKVSTDSHSEDTNEELLEDKKEGLSLKDFFRYIFLLVSLLIMISRIKF